MRLGVFTSRDGLAWARVRGVRALLDVPLRRAAAAPAMRVAPSAAAATCYSVLLALLALLADACVRVRIEAARLLLAGGVTRLLATEAPAGAASKVKKRKKSGALPSATAVQ
jgi:hypothetical protein